MITMFMNKMMLRLLLKECRSQSSNLRDEATAREKMHTGNGGKWYGMANHGKP